MTSADKNLPADATADVQGLPRLLARYRDPSLRRSLTEIAITVAPLAALWAAMWALFPVSYWLSLALAVPAAAFLVRLFMIQHDCGHGVVLPQPRGQRLGRPGHRRADADALRLLAAHRTRSITRPRAISTGAAWATSTR